MLQPLGKRIIIKPIIPEKKTAVILIKEDAPATFSVLAVGDEVKKVAVGDKIFIAAYSTSEIKFEGETFLLVNEDNIIAKVA